MATPSAVWRSVRTAQCGTIPVYPCCQSAGCCCAIQRASLSPQALLCTDPDRDAHDIIGWFVRRWALEVTFRETRDHLGIESQRQWSDQAIALTTPCLLALFSIVTLLTPRVFASIPAWLSQPPPGTTSHHPTFADALAALRLKFGPHRVFPRRATGQTGEKLSKPLCEGIIYALCQAA